MIPLNPVDFETEMTGRMDGGAVLDGYRDQTIIFGTIFILLSVCHDQKRSINSRLISCLFSILCICKQVAK